ncbi:hypothetical protein [Pseudomonas sp. S1_G07]
MKTTHNPIIPFLNRKQTISKENFEEIYADAFIYQKKDISIYELSQKIKVVIAQLSQSTKTFELAHSYEVVVDVPFLNNEEAEDSGLYSLIKSQDKYVRVLKAKKNVEFSFQEKIDDYDKETIAFANVINKLFGYLCVNKNLKDLILQASSVELRRKELESITVYKNIKFSDLRCPGTIFDKLDEYFITDEALNFASDMAFMNKEFDRKDKRTFRRLKNIIRKIARKQREIHLMRKRKIGENGEKYCSEELLKYQHEKDIEQQDFVNNTEVIYKNELTEKEESVPLAQFALTDERKASEIYMKVKDLEKEAEKKATSLCSLRLRALQSFIRTRQRVEIVGMDQHPDKHLTGFRKG